MHRLTTLRGRLVLWYLAVLAALLLALGVAQSLTLSSYLRSSSFGALRDTARAELQALGPCFIQSSSDLNANASSLARLLASREVGVKIVTPTGETLADQGFGGFGNTHSMRLTGSVIRSAIRLARISIPVEATQNNVGACLGHSGSQTTTHYHRRPPAPSRFLTTGGLMLYAVPLGPAGHAAGYALLGRSTQPADDTVRRSQLIFGTGAVLALLVAALLALPILNRALGPLYLVTKTAEAIAAGEFEERTNLTRSPDEIGRLSLAFDAMVDRLQSALSAATTSEERMRRFLADASHELRTPLTVLRGTSQVLIRQDVEEGDRATALQAIHSEAVRLSRLVDDLLILTRLDAGEPFRTEPLPLEEFVASFVGRYGSAWPDREITVDPSNWKGITALFDPEALRRILTNLLDNSARYSVPGSSILIRGVSTAQTVSVIVEDQGPGMKPEHAARVFERFYRGDKSRSRQSGGTGLGLAIAHALVEVGGAELRLDTAADRGTTVELVLPRQLPSAVRRPAT